MVPERDLSRLLGTISPIVQPGTYVFCSPTSGERPGDGVARLVFEEPEGTTIVVTRDEAKRLGWPATFPCRWIVLGASSDLEAVGFLAAVTAELARAGIAVNVVSAYHHDHLFVPEDRGDQAVAVLSALERRHRAEAGHP